MEKHPDDDQPSLSCAWYVVGPLTRANISSFPHRRILALPVVPITRGMHLSDTKLSLLMRLGFTLLYTIFGIMISRPADRASRRNIIISGIALWSLLTAACAGVKTLAKTINGLPVIFLSQRVNVKLTA
ncbi:MAG TPA: hypothetical protein VFW07_03030 [Parafilimonas sp.]|nr:hypothetical protein [Parafilimonas sp.]